MQSKSTQQEQGYTPAQKDFTSYFFSPVTAGETAQSLRFLVIELLDNCQGGITCQRQLSAALFLAEKLQAISDEHAQRVSLIA